MGIEVRVHKGKLPQAEVSAFIADLREAGATRIRRRPVDARGRVEVRWGDSELEQRRYAAEMQAWRLPMMLSGLVAAIVLLVLILLL